MSTSWKILYYKAIVFLQIKLYIQFDTNKNPNQVFVVVVVSDKIILNSTWTTKDPRTVKAFSKNQSGRLKPHIKGYYKAES